MELNVYGYPVIFLLQNLPERQIRQIFNSDKLKKFFENLFFFESFESQLGQLIEDEKGEKKLINKDLETGYYMIQKDGKRINFLKNKRVQRDLEKKRSRLIKLSQNVLNGIGQNARKLSPEIYGILLGC